MKISKIEDITNKLVEWCKNNRVDIQYIQSYQLRLSKGNKCVDIYPKNNKYHIIRSKKRGKYRHLMDFISFYFCN